MLRFWSAVGIGAMAAVAGADNVLVLSSGNPDLDNAVVATLQGAGHSVTVGPQYIDFDGTFSLAGVDTVYLQPNANWGAGDMPVEGQQDIIDFVQAGGGLVTCEWTIWKAYAQNSFLSIKPMLPASSGGYTSTDFTTYTSVTPDPVLNAGLPDAITFPEYNYSGSESTLYAIDGATVYYASSSAQDGVIGWDSGDGHVLSFSTVAGLPTVEDPEFGLLLANAMHWAGQGEIGCVADCDGSGGLNILDFVCFQQKFQAGDPAADINGDGVLNILDFVAFQQAFQAGCL